MNFVLNIKTVRKLVWDEHYAVFFPALMETSGSKIVYIKSDTWHRIFLEHTLWNG